MKYLIPLLVVLYIVWRFTSGRQRRDEARRQAPHEEGDKAALALPMVACARCGTHLPQNDALLRQQKWYCCEAHRDEAQ